MSGPAFAKELARAEVRLRAAGLTGADAFEAVLDAVRAGLGDAVAVHPALGDLTLGGQDVDLVGLAYERFFPDLFKGRVGQFFTPPPVVRLLLARLPLGPGVRVLDPTCGSGGLLVPAARAGAQVTGVDVDPRMASLCALNLRLAGFDGDVRRADVFAEESWLREGPGTRSQGPRRWAAEAAKRPESTDLFDVVVANPPFSVAVRDPEILARYELGRGRRQVASDVLFLEAIAGWVRPGGHAGLVLPWTVIANPSLAHVRARVDRDWVRRGLCALPEGVFRPFGGAAGRAAILWLQRRPCPSGPMASSRLDDPGYDVRSTALRITDSSMLDARIAGEGWVDVEGWLPEGEVPSDGPPLSTWVTALDESARLDGPHAVIELADVDRRTGEIQPRTDTLRGRRPVIRGPSVLVARMRPELGNVAFVPPGAVAAGSPEWIRLRSDRPHWLFHALRSPAWRARLPPTTGQTRPRTDADAVLQTTAPLPPEATLDRVEALSDRVLSARARLREVLDGLQDAVDAFVAGELDAEGLDAALDRLEGR